MTITFETEVNRFGKGVFRAVEKDVDGKRYSAYPFNIHLLPDMLRMMRMVNGDYINDSLVSLYSITTCYQPIRGSINFSSGVKSLHIHTYDGNYHSFSFYKLSETIRAYEDFLRRWKQGYVPE